MATFLRNQRKKSEPTVKPAFNGSANAEPSGSKTPDVQNKIIREDKEENNTTEYEVYLLQNFTTL